MVDFDDEIGIYVMLQADWPASPYEMELSRVIEKRSARGYWIDVYDVLIPLSRGYGV